MDAHERHQLFFNDLFVYLSTFMVVPLGRKSRLPLPFLTLKHPQTIMEGKCLTVEMVKRRLYQHTVLGLLNLAALGLISLKANSSENITLIQSFTVQEWYFLAKASLFFFITEVSGAFGQQNGREGSASSDASSV
jgi:hypothetical protein